MHNQQLPTRIISHLTPYAIKISLDFFIASIYNEICKEFLLSARQLFLVKPISAPTEMGSFFIIIKKSPRCSKGFFIDLLL